MLTFGLKTISPGYLGVKTAYTIYKGLKHKN